jgi:hypothetical protein
MGGAGGGSSVSWFIESWHPFAGHAFAVHRNPIPPGGPEAWSHADLTFMVMPPDFSPVPCPSEATAMLATRGPFQHQFLQSNGDQFAFDALAQLIELVRRVYLAGGMGQPPQLDLPPPPPPPKTPLTSNWTQVAAALDQRDRSATLAVHLAPAGRPDRSTIDLLAHAIEASIQAHDHELLELTLSTLSSLANWRRAGTGATVEDERSWAVLVAEMNPWGSWREAADRIAASLSSPPHSVPGAGPVCWPFGAVDGVADALFGGLLWKIPAPAPAANSLAARARATFLGDHLSLAMADPRYRQDLSWTVHALPLFACALALAAARSRDFRSGQIEKGFLSVRRAAASWLAEHLPSATLPVPGAEQVIDQIIDKRSSSGGTP